MTKGSSKTGEADFEKALEELEGLVEGLEAGRLPLEETLRQFERGIELTRQCQEALKKAQQRVDMLASKAGDAEATPFEPQS